MIKYKHGDTEYFSIFGLRKAFPNVSFSDNPSAETLEFLGIEVIEYEPPQPTFEELKAMKKAEITAARYAAATGYLKIGENTYNIDKDSQTAFLGTLAAFQSGMLKTTNWKTVEGFVELTAEEFMTVVVRVLAYIEECFGREKELLAQIDACQATEEIAAIQWVQ